MADYLPEFTDADAPVTLTASAPVVGGQLVTWAGAVAGDASQAVAGVAGHDAAAGQKLTVWGVGKHIGTASAAIAQGAPVCAAANGQLRTWATTDPVAAYLGRARAAAGGAGQSVKYSLFNV